MPSVEARPKLANDADRASFETDVTAMLDTVNATLNPHEKLGFAVIVGEQWGIHNGFLTPTMKIKRNVVEKHYQPQVDDWYAQRKPVIWA